MNDLYVHVSCVCILFTPYLLLCMRLAILYVCYMFILWMAFCINKVFVFSSNKVIMMSARNKIVRPFTGSSD